MRLNFFLQASLLLGLVFSAENLSSTPNPVVKELMRFASRRFLEYFINQVRFEKENIIRNRERERLRFLEERCLYLEALQQQQNGSMIDESRETRGAGLLPEEGCSEQFYADIFETWMVFMNSKKAEFAEVVVKAYHREG